MVITLIATELELNIELRVMNISVGYQLSPTNGDDSEDNR